MIPVLKRGQIEELTIIDPSFNDRGHSKAANYYNLTRDQVHAELETHVGGIGADEFLLWIQARYALDCLNQHADGGGNATIAAAINMLAAPISEHYLISWADNFLPAWTRLCWRANLVHCAGYQAHELRLEERDFHLPWNLPPLVRPDLRAAANILGLIRTAGWDFSSFPGAAWDSNRGRLVVPMPAWGDIDDLVALKPLIDAIKENLGFVQTLEILPVNDDSTVVISAAKVEEFKLQLAAMMQVLRFSDPLNIGLVFELREA
jgi:hypothetical protein